MNRSDEFNFKGTTQIKLDGGFIHIVDFLEKLRQVDRFQLFLLYVIRNGIGIAAGVDLVSKAKFQVRVSQKQINIEGSLVVRNNVSHTVDQIIDNHMCARR
jgi:hypothetical protein